MRAENRFGEQGGYDIRSMISALHRVPKRERRAVAQEWARRSNAVQAAARMAREPDWETQRWRALQDARGTVMREGRTYRKDGRVIDWRVVRSVRGKTNQVDIVVDGRRWQTCGQRKLRKLLRQEPT